jgi:SAM-dependent methyltransferase
VAAVDTTCSTLPEALRVHHRPHPRSKTSITQRREQSACLAGDFSDPCDVDLNVETAGDLYERIGRGYRSQRRTDPRIAARIWQALGDNETVLNVGAGTGSYEPRDRKVIAVEPSATMRAQRSMEAAPCVAARAEVLPFADDEFDVAMSVLSDHHWADPIGGLREMRRVARRVVVFQWDSTRLRDFWLVRDYLPEYLTTWAHPTLAQRAAAIGADIHKVPIPWNCEDGFFHSYWRRPEAYLQRAVRQGTSVWSVLGREVECRAVKALREDLASGFWQARNHTLLTLEEAELGARLLIA